MDIGDQLAEIAEKAGAKLEAVVRKTVIEMGSQMVDISPVDTGRFKGNWFYNARGQTTEQTDPSGRSSIARITQGALNWTPGEVMMVSNSLPYAYRLENGWSKQAPAGFVRVTVENFSAHFARALQDTP